jgi:hypothetical protein
MLNESEIFGNFLDVDHSMCSMIDSFSVLDDNDLRRFMFDVKF